LHIVNVISFLRKEGETLTREKIFSEIVYLEGRTLSIVQINQQKGLPVSSTPNYRSHPCRRNYQPFAPETPCPRSETSDQSAPAIVAQRGPSFCSPRPNSHFHSRR